jgi:hypothetical protein
MSVRRSFRGSYPRGRHERSLRDSIVPSDCFPGGDESASFGGAAPIDIQSRDCGTVSPSDLAVLRFTAKERDIRECAEIKP